MNTAIVLDEKDFKAVAEKSRANGQTPEQYFHALIQVDGLTFDDILAPIRQGFATTSDEELDELLLRARKAMPS